MQALPTDGPDAPNRKAGEERHRNAAGDAGRIILDITSLARWRGPAVGILRVEQALARFALARRPEITLSYFDKATAEFLAVNPTWAEHIVSWEGAVGRRRHRLLDLVPSPYAAVSALERLRSACRHEPTARVIAHIQKALLLLRRRRRRGIVPLRLATGAPLALGSGDVILSPGPDWTHKDADAILALKHKLRFGYVAMCYDLIPLMLPQYFLPDDVAAFRRYWTRMFTAADKILVISRRVEGDLRDYCERAKLRPGAVRLVPLGCDAARPGTGAKLPDGLESGRFVLYVSTIEPRKGHDLLLRVWRRLLAEGIPQRHRFKLVLVGRRGWQVDAVLRQIGDAAAFDGTLMHLVGIADDELAALYAGAAFCVYPSRYEGLGLPVIEAFAHKKAVIASSGGALAETVGGFSPCLDPADEEAWFETLKGWISDPDMRTQYEAKIEAGFSCPTWEQAAAAIFASLRDARPRGQA